MSKHKHRHERRRKWREMIRRELDDEILFTEHFKAILFSNDGLDYALDGNPIKADFFAAIKEWEKTDPHAARACLSLIEKVVHPQSARATLSLVERSIH